jgi:predicted TIM-barrel fold metal-dependent hydrolase
MNATIELHDIPIADNHCFAFAPSSEKITEDQFVRLFSVGGPTVFGVKTNLSSSETAELARSAVAFKHSIRLLSRFLGCANDLKSVVDARNKRSADFAGYVRNLFGSVNLRALMIDSGFQPVSVAEFRTYAPAQVGWVFRIEPLVKQLLESEGSFKELIAKFDEALLQAVRNRCVAFKTIIAYRSGLDLQVASEEDARADFDRVAKEGRLEWFGPLAKRLRDHLVLRTIKTCIRHDKVMQIHTGLGDTDIVGTKCNPILLQSFLKHEEVLPAKIVLIHGGYPYFFEAAWLANVLGNVHVELSTPLPPYFAPPASSRRFVETIQAAPTRKIVYGSDAGEIPEMHWLSAKIGKSALQLALGKLIELDILDEPEAQQIAREILFENAKRLYKLD